MISEKLGKETALLLINASDISDSPTSITTELDERIIADALIEIAITSDMPTYAD